MTHPENLESNPAAEAWRDALSDPNTVAGLDEGLVDIEAGGTRPWDEILAEGNRATGGPLAARIKGEISEQEYIDLVNTERIKDGLSPLIKDTDGTLVPEWILKPY